MTSFEMIPGCSNETYLFLSKHLLCVWAFKQGDVNNKSKQKVAPSHKSQNSAKWDSHWVTAWGMGSSNMSLLAMLSQGQHDVLKQMQCFYTNQMFPQGTSGLSKESEEKDKFRNDMGMLK